MQILSTSVHFLLSTLVGSPSLYIYCTTDDMMTMKHRNVRVVIKLQSAQLITHKAKATEQSHFLHEAPAL